MKAKGVIDVHHIHVWALSTTENALTAHLVIDQNAVSSFNSIKDDLRHRMEHLSISHSTFEPEFSNEKCLQIDC